VLDDFTFRAAQYILVLVAEQLLFATILHAQVSVVAARNV
jgi:hypothetical protein